MELSSSLVDNFSLKGGLVPPQREEFRMVSPEFTERKILTQQRFLFP